MIPREARLTLDSVVMLRDPQSKDLHEALVDFYSEGLSAETLVDRTFALTARIVPLSLNSYGVLDPRTGALSARFDSAPPGVEEAFGAFGRLMNRHAAFRFDPGFAGGRPYSVHQVHGRDGFERLDIHDEVYRPMRLTDHCFVNVPAGPRSVVFVGFLRDGRPFGEDELEQLRFVQPHLANGRRLALAITASGEIPLTPELFELAGFTPRECDVLAWLTQGKTNEEIATLLRLRADSVSRHLQNIYGKLGVEHRVGATIAALQLARELHGEAVLLGQGERTHVVPTRPRALRSA